MTVTYGFYDSLAGDRVYNSEQMSRIFEGIITDGVFQALGSALMVVESSGMTVNVGTGRAWFSNTWTLNDAVLPLTISPSVVGLNRIDTVVLEVNKELAVRANTIKVINGTPASSPVAPTLTNTATVKQYPLADVYVGNGVSAVTQANITNRIGTASTPFITGILESLDSSVLMAQWEAEFDAWFANLQDQLDDNQAGNLQNQINTLTTNLSTETTNRTNADTALSTNIGTGWVAAGETWTVHNISGLTYQIAVSGDKTTKYYAGMRLKLTQTTVKYFILTNVVYSAPNTILTVFGGTDYTLVNAAISSPFFSIAKVPAGFNPRPSKWSHVVGNTSSLSQLTPVAGTWYGVLSVPFPPGSWRAEYYFAGVVEGNASATSLGFRATLGSINGGESSTNNTTAFLITGFAAGSSPAHRESLTKIIEVDVTVETTWYVSIQTDTNNASAIRLRGDFAATTIRFVCAFL